jgi:hypothetical protein
MKFLERRSPTLLDALYLYRSLQFGFDIVAGAIQRLISPKDIFGSKVKRVW